jgi:hypothetical protein
MDKSHLTPQSRIPALNADSLETIEDIKKTISKLRDEQENIFATQNKIGKLTGLQAIICLHQSVHSSSLYSTLYHFLSHLHRHMLCLVSSYSRDQGVDKIFEHCCLISMVRRAPYLLGTWPIAMVGSLVNKSVSLGNFESYGSLWRFVRLGETTSNSNSVRVVLECSVSECTYAKRQCTYLAYLL